METNRGRYAAVLPVVWLLMPAGGLAQDRGDPETSARAYIEAVQRQDYDDMSRLTHPDELRRFRDAVRTMVAAETSDAVLQDMFEVADSTAFLALSAHDVYARFLRAVMSGGPEEEEFFESMEVTMLGRLPSSEPDVVVVRYAISFNVEGAPPPMDDSVRLKRYGDEWRVLLKAGMLEWLESP